MGSNTWRRTLETEAGGRLCCLVLVNERGASSSDFHSCQSELIPLETDAAAHPSLVIHRSFFFFFLHILAVNPDDSGST